MDVLKSKKSVAFNQVEHFPQGWDNPVSMGAPRPGGLKRGVENDGQFASRIPQCLAVQWTTLPVIQHAP
jgi:hypothetical protein